MCTFSRKHIRKLESTGLQQPTINNDNHIFEDDDEVGDRPKTCKQ